MTASDGEDDSFSKDAGLGKSHLIQEHWVSYLIPRKLCATR